MQMRAERGWASFKLTPQKWVVETTAYNARLQELMLKEKSLFVSKNPRALVDKLSVIETQVFHRVATKNFTCKLLDLVLCAS